MKPEDQWSINLCSCPAYCLQGPLPFRHKPFTKFFRNAGLGEVVERACNGALAMEKEFLIKCS
jgi:hypothetical protein